MSEQIDYGVDFLLPEPETWHLNGFNMTEVIVIRDGPDAAGKRYRDGRHQVKVADFQTMEDARRAVDAANNHKRLQRCAEAAIEGLTPRDVNERRAMERVLTILDLRAIAKGGASTSDDYNRYWRGRRQGYAECATMLRAALAQEAPVVASQHLSPIKES